MSAQKGTVAEVWEMVAQSRDARQTLASVLEATRREFPIQSIHLFAFDLHEKTIVGLGSVFADGTRREPDFVECSDAKWAELSLWLDENRALRQQGKKRSGKLAWLTPSFITGEVVGLPLCKRIGELGAQTGAAILEFEHDRTLREDLTNDLASFAGPLWLLLQTLGPGRFELGREAELLPRATKTTIETIIGAEGGLKSVMERVELVSPSDMPVLILGETGTGKEVVARAIHQRSSRAGRPFIRVNCGAIPPELIDSQLFGHERGSFTGASDQRKGWFERADGGTLFLDEIGELPLAAQVRLLRVLQDHQIERVGGQEAIHVDVRIIAATHRDLASMVHKRTFREDLWYRVNMFPILLPRLCERLEDIPALARHFIKKAATNFGLPAVEPSASSLVPLLEYAWPGNIREMQAVIDRAVILGRGERLDIENALGIGAVPRYDPAPESNEPTYYEVVPEDSYRRRTASSQIELPDRDADGDILELNDAIRRHIERALAIAGGQIEGNRGAAKLLNVNPHTLRAKMRKLGIQWDRFRSP